MGCLARWGGVQGANVGISVSVCLQHRIMTQVTAERRHRSTITSQESRSSQGQTVAIQKAVSKMPEVGIDGITGV